MSREIELAKRLLESKGYEVTEKLAVGQTAELKVDSVDLGYCTLEGTEYDVVAAEDLDFEVEKNPLDVYYVHNETGVVLSLLSKDGEDTSVAKVKRIR